MAQGLPVLRATGQIGAQSQRLRDAIHTQHHLQQRSNRLLTLPQMTLASIVEVGLLVLLGVGILLLNQGLSLPSLFALLVIAVRFSEPISLFASFTGVFDIVEIALQRIDALLQIQPLAVQSPAASLTGSDIRFEQVSFTYAGQVAPTLRSLSYHLPERSLTVLVGPSGSGKTTFTRLIARYADVQQGSIQIGGVDIRRVEATELLKQISVVFQDVYLFDDTIRQNIRLAKPMASDAEVEAAARASHCHEFVQRLPQGYDTRVGEIGGALSGGERQRISIARAILNDAPIVLLDEPTSALDTASERAVQQAIYQLVQNKTVVVIAHRLSTIVAADQILVLDAGQLVERGSHAQMLGQGGRYASLWQAQQRSRQWLRSGQPMP
jgi:ATP-binding cassette, subfamily B, bacterial IrtB/YbtQ